MAFEGLPPSGLYRATSAEALPVHTLEFELCIGCGLVRQESAPYLKDYTRVDRTAALRLPNHLSELVAGLASHRIERSDLVVEVGSGDGSFLDALRSAGYTNLVGVEPSIGLAERSRRDGLTIVSAYFGFDCSAQIVRTFGRPRAIVCRHTVEHVPDPFSFVLAMRECLSSGDGTLVIELPDGLAIPELLNVYELWDEHLCYYTAENAGLMLRRAGFSLSDVRAYPHLDTRNLVLWAHPASIGDGTDRGSDWPVQRHLDQWRQMPAAWSLRANALRNLVRCAPRPVYAVGASHSQTNFFGFADLGGAVDFMIDDDPYKSGKVPPMKGGAPIIISTLDFETRAENGTVVLTGFGYPDWMRRVRAHAESLEMQVIDPSDLGEPHE